MSQATYVEISFREAGELFLFEAGDFALSTNDSVVVDTEHGPALGTVKRVNPESNSAPPSFELFKVLRLATEDDLRRASRHRQKEREAYEYCRQKIEELNLPMKLIRAEYFFNGSKLLFYFSAEGRVDFRTLVRDLARYFQKRIEMRQIGVRDSAKLVGGVGVCGQELCCSRFLRQFHPVSIRMVKDQGLPLNQQKVSGVCGRLMCCLAYEQGLYKEMRKRLPKVGQDVQTDKGVAKVRDVFPVQEKVRLVYFDEEPPVEEEAYLRDLHEFRDIPLPEAEPVQFDNVKKGKRKKRRGLEPLMEPRRGQGQGQGQEDKRRSKPSRGKPEKPLRKKARPTHREQENETELTHDQEDSDNQALTTTQPNVPEEQQEVASPPLSTAEVSVVETVVVQQETTVVKATEDEVVVVSEKKVVVEQAFVEPSTEEVVEHVAPEDEESEAHTPELQPQQEATSDAEENKEKPRRRNRRRRRKRPKEGGGDNSNAQAASPQQENQGSSSSNDNENTDDANKRKRRRRRRKRKNKSQGGNDNKS
ncbi:MAG: hypothetical protein EP343_23565 [Deltaproteobacteria bacterium]|nr:MAG: hypothetical protein EP343_23565 [Deltaproteobacteria bacterium]